MNPVDTANESSASLPKTPVFSSKQTLHRSLSRADAHLPESPNTKAEIIQRLVTKHTLRINIKKIEEENYRRNSYAQMSENGLWSF